VALAEVASTELVLQKSNRSGDLTAQDGAFTGFGGVPTRTPSGGS
jgi:hypothetical protein